METSRQVVGDVKPSAPRQTVLLTHPNIRLKKLALFEVMGELIKPTTLHSINTEKRQQGTYYFQLSSQQATDIASNRDTRVLLRFCLLKTSCEQDDSFPLNVTVNVNDKLCKLPINQMPTNKPGVEGKRPPPPMDITSYLNISSTIANEIKVSWCRKYTFRYVISVYLVRKLSSAELLNGMKTGPNIQPSESTRALIKVMFNEDADCDIATTMLKVSVVCPLGKIRMTTPCRASTCSHMQCFDAFVYLQMNEKKPTWKCPVCNKPAPYESLVIDGYFQEVLSSSDLSADTNEIQLNKDGSWSTHVIGSDSQSLLTPCKKYQSVDISDDIEIVKSKVTTSTVILIESDSDDDVPLKKSKQINPNPPYVNATAASRTNGVELNTKWALLSNSIVEGPQ